jgi:tetratricopeptide (TPR) repeat protein
LELYPGSTEALLIKANYSEYYCDTTTAAEQYLAAIENDPTDPTARHWYAIVLLGAGHIELARKHIDTAMEIDPLISAVVSISAYTHALQGQSEESIKLAQRSAALGFRGGNSELEGLMRLMAGERQASAELILEVAQTESDPRHRELLNLFARAIDNPSAVGYFEQFLGRAEDYHSFDAAEISDYLALLGSSHLIEFNAGVECPLLGQMLWSSNYRDQRGTSEFFELMDRSGLVDFWREYGWPDDCASLDQTLAECPE